MESRSMKRARRTAVAVKDGPEILDYIAAPKSRGLLVSRAEQGAPPVGAISEISTPGIRTWGKTRTGQAVHRNVCSGCPRGGRLLRRGEGGPN